MKKICLILFAFAFLSAGCDNPDTEFGTEGVVLTKQLLERNIESSYFSSEVDPEESPYLTLHVAGVYRTGVQENMPEIRVEIEADRAYMAKLLADLSDPTAEQTEEMTAVAGLKGALIVPEDCYEIGNLNIVIPKGELSAAVEVKLDKQKLAKLDAFSTWVLPAFRIKNTSMEQIGSIETSFVSLKILKSYKPLPEDLTGWQNLVQGKPISTTCPPWSQAVTHAVTWAVDGDNDNSVDSNRWIPFCNTTATIAPWFEIDLQGTYRIDGFKLFYCIPNTVVRENCDFWIKTPEGEWKKVAELRGNKSNTPSYQLFGDEATHIRIYWDLIKNSSANYAVKLKEVEVYTKK